MTRTPRSGTPWPHPRARELADLLLDKGADPNDGQGLYNSMFSPGDEWLELLLSRGLTADAPVDPDGTSAVTTLDYQLAAAANRGLADRVALLLDHGADAAGYDEWYSKRSHIANALLNGHTEVAAMLVERGASEPGLTGADGFRAAVMAADREAARTFLTSDPALLKTPNLLVDAAGGGKIQAVRLLLELGADPDATMDSGRVALHEAAWSGHEEIVRLLLERGAHADIREGDHHATPAGFAHHAGQYAVRDLLLDRSGDVFELVGFGKADRLKELLKTDSAPAKSVDAAGRTPLHALHSDTGDAAAVLSLLLRHGEDINAAAADGSTPLSAAVERDDGEAAEVLRARGAR